MKRKRKVKWKNVIIAGLILVSVILFAMIPMFHKLSGREGFGGELFAWAIPTFIAVTIKKW